MRRDRDRVIYPRSMATPDRSGRSNAIGARASAIGALAAMVAAACGGGQAAPAVSAPIAVQIPDTRMVIATGDAGSPLAAPACSRDPALTPVDVPLFEEANEALRSGDLHRARAIFAHIVTSYRSSAPLLACYNAATSAILEARRKAGAKESFDVVPPKAAPPPPYTATLIAPARERAGLGPRTTVRLAKASERKNGITDEALWYRDNALFRPQYFLPSSRDYMFLELTIFDHDVAWPIFEAHTYTSWQRDPSLLPEPLPVTIPLGYGTLPLTTALSSGEYVIASYGGSPWLLSPYLAVFRRDGSVRAFLDLRSYTQGPGSNVIQAKVGSMKVEQGGRTLASSDIIATGLEHPLELVWAVASGSVLYVEHAVNGYTKESGGKTGYLTAIDMDSGDVMWRSAAQVANAKTFLLDAPRGVIVSAYGFTAEPRFVYVLDASTGVTVQKTQVTATPEIFVKKEDVVHLRGYDRDYTFTWR